MGGRMIAFCGWIRCRQDFFAAVAVVMVLVMAVIGHVRVVVGLVVGRGLRTGEGCGEARICGVHGLTQPRLSRTKPRRCTTA